MAKYFILYLFPLFVLAQENCFYLKDKNGISIEYATIRLKNTKNGLISDQYG
jgi:hypothetical protein